MTEIQAKMIKLQEAIYINDYFIDIYHESLMRAKMSSASIDEAQHTDLQLASMCSAFWFLLPDTATIRRAPFFDLCSIAEHIFDDEESDDCRG